jgi:hypothetical protein
MMEHKFGICQTGAVSVEHNRHLILILVIRFFFFFVDFAFSRVSMRSSSKKRMAFRNSIRDWVMCLKKSDFFPNTFSKSVKNLPTGHIAIWDSLFLAAIFNSFKANVQDPAVELCDDLLF